jgi:hypothetical protein
VALEVIGDVVKMSYWKEVIVPVHLDND